MSTLDRTLRRQLENAVKAARAVAEAGAKKALDQLAVGHHEPHGSMSAKDRTLRNRLRAHGRQLGDVRDKDSGRQTLRRLTQECAYEHWHRMLFARFLAENDLLIEPEMEVALSLDECVELAREQHRDWMDLASAFAVRMLPQIFRPDDPVLEVSLPPETRSALEDLLKGLPTEVFTADDSLGWVYQFWQAEEKKRVNESGEKIGADELPAVTQLFTEDYMVEFLLHNTLGAWWAGKQLNHGGTESTEEEIRKTHALPAMGGLPAYEWTYLRFINEANQSDDESAPLSEDSSSSSVPLRASVVKSSWRPAAGVFPHWPKTAAALRVLDPCCGSGHFLVFALPILARMRMIEEGLSAADACDAVLRDNLFGLELDQRCTQIAAFNLALAAWKMIDAASRRVPESTRQDAASTLRLNVACSGLSVGASKQAWLKLAKGSPKLEGGLARLYDTFNQAPILGSLIDPRAGEVENALIHATFDELRPELDRALAASGQDDESQELGVTAQGLMDAVRLLTAEYTLIITNVPYLARGKQEPRLRDFAERHYPEAKQDLATVFLRRCLDFVGGRGGILPPSGDAPGWRVYPGTVAAVTPQNWLFLTSYKKLREQLLKEQSLNAIVRLGPGAFETISGEVVNVALCILSDVAPTPDHAFAGLDASAGKGAAAKAAGVEMGQARYPLQGSQRKNPDCVISIEDTARGTLLNTHGRAWQGLVTGDDNRFHASFWEIAASSSIWSPIQQAPALTSDYTGGSDVIRWEQANGALHQFPSAHNFPPKRLVGSRGIAVQRMRKLNVCFYEGWVFDDSVAPLVVDNDQYLAAVWSYCRSSEYAEAVRNLNQHVKVVPGTLTKVPFDLDHWQKVADEQYPHGLPEPYSDDPTQWIFHGHPCGSVRWNEDTKRLELTPEPRVDDTVLQVAVARVLGYKWPAELEVARASSSSKSPEQDALATEVTGASSSSKNPEQDALATTEQEQDALGTSIRLSEESRALVARCAELHGFADDDGIVCLSPIQSEAPAAQRVTALLAAAYGDAWSAAMLEQLLAASDAKGKTLDDWLRDKFFAQHCQLFHHRPFIWHVWDGLRDGFNALVNYHQLAGPDGEGRRTLDKLRYTYLGDWISRQRQDQANEVEGADGRLAAALHLQKELDKIAEGDAPYDLFIRWKPLHEQPIGWAPDINDGVRLNIRPWMHARPLAARARDACILRVTPKNIKWKKDRGKEPQRDKEDYPWFWGWDEKTQDFTGGKTFDGNRWNDLHYTNAVKQAARTRKREGQ